MFYNEGIKILFKALLFDTALFVATTLMGNLYIITVIFSTVLSIISRLNEKKRLHELGYIGLNVKDTKIESLIPFLTVFFPFLNVIVGTIEYYRAFCLEDDEFLKKFQGRKLKPRQVLKEYEPGIKFPSFAKMQTVTKESELVKEYKEVSMKDVNVATKIMSAEALIEAIMLDVNLKDEDKKKLLITFRNDMLYLGSPLRGVNKLMRKIRK